MTIPIFQSFIIPGRLRLTVPTQAALHRNAELVIDYGPGYAATRLSLDELRGLAHAADDAALALEKLLEHWRKTSG